eukprot:1057292-Pleurochrysis_carterae.AAC.1
MVVNTNTGASPVLRSYYAYWEREIYAALTRMVVRALTACYKMLASHEPTADAATDTAADADAKSPDGADGTVVSRPPLFRVGAILAAPEVLVSPPLTEVNKVLTKIVRSLVESTKGFVRWMHGSCLETPPQPVGDDEETVSFVFYTDVVVVPEVAALVGTITRSIKRTFGRVNKQLDAYRKYDQLWKVDRTQHLAKFEQKNPTCVMFDSRLQSYTKVVAEAQAMQTEISVDFMAVSVGSLLRDIQEHARTWVASIARLMNSMVKQGLIDMHELIQ